jgi:hypothetical protein
MSVVRFLYSAHCECTFNAVFFDYQDKMLDYCQYFRIVMTILRVNIRFFHHSFILISICTIIFEFKKLFLHPLIIKKIDL